MKVRIKMDKEIWMKKKKKKCKHKIRSNPWQLGYPKNKNLSVKYFFFLKP